MMDSVQALFVVIIVFLQPASVPVYLRPKCFSASYLTAFAVIFFQQQNFFFALLEAAVAPLSLINLSVWQIFSV